MYDGMFEKDLIRDWE